jgi:hypothetical protein
MRFGAIIDLPDMVCPLQKISIISHNVLSSGANMEFLNIL